MVSDIRPTYTSVVLLVGLTMTLNRHVLTNDEKSDYLQAVKCLMESPAKSGITGAISRWDELQSCHVEQSNFIHGVGYVAHNSTFN